MTKGKTCKVNLDRLIDFSQIQMANTESPIEIIDEALKKANANEERVPQRGAELQPQCEPHKTIEKLHPVKASGSSQKSCRMVKVPPKLSNYVRNNPSGQCPGCRVFVNDGENGVVCEQCQAYWHYSCANVTQEQLDTIWHEEFVCEVHRNGVIQSESVRGNKNEMNGDTTLQSITIKVNPYCIDKLGKIKFKINNMDSGTHIRAKACMRQHTVKVNSVTYQIIMENLSSFGALLGGLTIKRADKDREGEDVQVQYYVNIKGDIPVSVTCYHTTNNILLQLRATGKKKSAKIEEYNQTQLRLFVNESFKNLINKIENSGRYRLMTKEMEVTLTELKNALEGQSEKQNEISNVVEVQGESSATSGLDLDHNQLSPLASPLSSPRSRKGKRCNEQCENTKTGLRSRISNLEKEKLNLQQKLATVEKHQESLRSTISSKDGITKSQNQIIEEQLKTINSQKKLISDLEVKSKTHGEFASSFIDIIVSEGDDESGDEDSIGARSGSNSVLKQMHNKIKSLEAEILTYESKLVEQQESKDVLQGKLVESQKKLDTKCKEYKALKAQLTCVEETVMAREKEIKAAQCDHSEAEGRIESLRIENDSLRVVLKEVEGKNHELLEVVEKSKSETLDLSAMEQLLEKSKEKDQEITQLKETVQFIELSEAEAKSNWTLELKKVKQLQNLLDDEKERRLMYQEKSSSLSIEIAEWKTKLERNRSLLNITTNQAGNPEQGNVGSSRSGSEDAKNETESISQNTEKFPCIFELQGLCRRGLKCNYDHDISSEIKSDSSAVSNILLETSKRIGKCAFELTAKGSCPGKSACEFSHLTSRPRVEGSKEGKDKRICFKELMKEGSCKWGDLKCRFSHQITKAQREDANYIQIKQKEKDERASRCIYEFQSKGGCRNGGECPFSHDITDSDRDDDAIKKEIKEKISLMKNHQNNDTKNQKRSDPNREKLFSKEMAALRTELLQLKEMIAKRSP